MCTSFIPSSTPCRNCYSTCRTECLFKRDKLENDKIFTSCSSLRERDLHWKEFGMYRSRIDSRSVLGCNNSYPSSNRSGYTYTDHIDGNRTTLSDVCYLYHYRGDIKISEFCSGRRRCSFIYSYDSNSGCFLALFLLANVASNGPTRNAGNVSTHHCRTHVCNLFHCYKMVQQGEVSSGSLMELKTMRIPEAMSVPKQLFGLLISASRCAKYTS